MPVHVDRGNRQGDAMILKAIQKLKVLAVGVGMITAPPVPESKAGQERCCAGNTVERTYRRAVVVPVNEYVFIGTVTVLGFEFAVIRKCEGRSVVK